MTKDLNIGETLKAARLSRGIILEEVENATHIKYLYLEALEENELQKIPARAYARAYLRKYAEFLGFDPVPFLSVFDRTALASYSLELPMESGSSSPRVKTFLRKRNPWKKALVIAASIIGAVLMILLLINMLIPEAPGQESPPASVPTDNSPAPYTSDSASYTPSSPQTLTPSLLSEPEAQVRVTALEESGIKVIVNGGIQFEGKLQKGMKGTWRGQEITLEFEDPALFLLEINGQELTGPLPAVFKYPEDYATP